MYSFLYNYIFSIKYVKAGPITSAYLVGSYSSGNEYYGSITWIRVSHRTVLQLNNRSGVTYHYSYKATNFTTIYAHGIALLGYWAER